MSPLRKVKIDKHKDHKEFSQGSQSVELHLRENFSGKVIHGLKKGRGFGFPTANILLDDSDLVIDKGVYAVDVFLDNVIYQGMLYVGNRPTLAMNTLSIEIHIFDFNETIYDKKLQFIILKKIRNEIKFDTTEQLITQLNIDKYEIKSFFSCL